MGHNTVRGMPGSAQACLRLATLTLAVLLTALGQAQVLYETGFEPDEGYDMQFTLAGQGGWLAEGTGGSGLVEETWAEAAWLKKLSPTWAIRLTSVFSHRRRRTKAT